MGNGVQKQDKNKLEAPPNASEDGSGIKRIKKVDREVTDDSSLVDVALHLEVAVPGAEMDGGGKHHLYVLLLLRKHPGRHGLVRAPSLSHPRKP